MKAKRAGHSVFILAIIAAIAGYNSNALAQDSAEPPPIPSEELPAGSDVLTQGPVHEAFAKPVNMEAQAPLQVPQQPPDNIQEVPPVERPAGADIVWVPGYWAWDADRQDFIWVSGCWRNSPPHTYWVPGHWLQAGNSWEWIGGFWKPMSDQPQQEIEYLPAPPAPVEIEAPGSPPQADQVWVPGCWYWHEGKYVIRHGYWMAQQLGWTWAPSHYAWTPRGYIFVDGHWDHDLDDRGVLFCPAFFPRQVRVRAGFSFSPGTCVDLGMLRMNFFVYPAYRHYYFGDYYDDAYAKVGILPWFKCETIHTWYDPLFVYDKWHFGKTDPHWVANLTRGFDSRHSNRDLRPARTFKQLQAQFAKMPAKQRPERPLVQTIKDYSASKHTPLKFERINTTERQQIAVKARDVQTLRTERKQWEAPARSTTENVKGPTPVESKPAKTSRRQSKPAVVPPRPVRVTQPEKVTVPNTPRTPQPSESRFIAKQPPSHPPQEQRMGAVAPGRGRK